MLPRYSVIIPAYNEERLLGRLLDSMRKFDGFGDWHYFPLIVEGLRHLLKRHTTAFMDKYWYKPNR
jgi:cellulose synthase/poly-beta-1,6-N-acetylglucosamine synthase-like glycosyltransferase